MLSRLNTSQTEQNFWLTMWRALHDRTLHEFNLVLNKLFGPLTCLDTICEVLHVVVSTQHVAPHKCINVPLLPGFQISQSGGSGRIPQPPAAHLLSPLQRPLVSNVFRALSRASFTSFMKQHASPHKCITVPLLPGFQIPR